MTTQLEAISDVPVDRPTRRTPLGAAEIVAAVFGLVAALLVALDTPGVVRTVIVLVALLALPGWAVVRRFPRVEPGARVALTVVGGIALMTIVALGMVWTGFWHPRIAAVVILVAASLAIGLRPLDRPDRDPGEADAEPEVDRTPGSRIALWPWLALVVAAILWVVGLTLTDSDDLGQWGLLPAFPVAWYLSVALAFVVVLVGLLSKRRRRGLVASSMALLVVVLFASANLVEDAPRLPWVYKHIAVTNYIQANGSVNPAIDLYNRWPGFFSFSAWLGSATGVHEAATQARWAEIFFALIDALLVLGIARAVSRHRRFAWTAVLVFTLGNWVGQNYYSPQAFAFMFYLAATLLALSALAGEPRRVMRWAEGILAKPALRLKRAVVTERIGIRVSRRGRWFAIAAVLVLQGLVVASHQLTPYVAILALLPLFVLGYLRPFWVGLAVFALPVLYLLPNLDYVQQHFGLFSSFDPLANATTASVSSVGVSEAASLQSHGVVLLTGVVVLLAFAGFVRRLLNGHIRTTLVVAWLSIAPILTLLGQSYGGEGKFRVFLFGLPFYAMGVSWLFWTGKGLPRVRKVGLVATVTVFLTLFVGTYFQPEASLRVSAKDVAAATWLDEHFAEQDTVWSVTDTFPELIGPHYPYYIGRYAQAGSMDGIPNYTADPLTAEDIEKVILTRSGTGPVWIAFSATQEQTAIVSGAFTKKELSEIEATVAANSTLAYNRGGVRIYESTR